jgi:hypothetical protein
MKNDPPSAMGIPYSARRSKCLRLSWTGVLFCLLHFSASLALATRDDFEHPNSFIGNAGWSGGLERWVQIAEVPVAKGTILPLRLRFSSDVTRENPLFGGHWWCPLLESWVRGTPDYLEFTTLGGGRRFLLKSDGWRTKDGQASGHEADGIVKIESAQWHYRYKDGRIEEAIAPDGTRLNWQYRDGELAAIRCLDDGADVLTVDRTGGRVKVHGEFGEFVFRKESEKLWLKLPDGRAEEVTKRTVLKLGNKGAV